MIRFFAAGSALILGLSLPAGAAAEEAPPRVELHCPGAEQAKFFVSTIVTVPPEKKVVIDVLGQVIYRTSFPSVEVAEVNTDLVLRLAPAERYGRIESEGVRDTYLTDLGNSVRRAGDLILPLRGSALTFQHYNFHGSVRLAHEDWDPQVGIYDVQVKSETLSLPGGLECTFSSRSHASSFLMGTEEENQNYYEQIAARTTPPAAWFGLGFILAVFGGFAYWREHGRGRRGDTVPHPNKSNESVRDTG
ncbi:hypothetical protein A6A08_18365 [Nocardiopsis sp. TSRI0078]|uniref:hypothetical protein n=1 Tax=unclassified Nocardiopsis TaxID=2649073 RepID=UPI000939A5E6|nr:hypothetical protein [Nocardiopsis sp. TSRI0078]OKI22914.1 hypothetical protein A6A08_18365 [Nocardiopsis sp. TSRI0078]